jgi:hypothetical protein
MTSQLLKARKVSSADDRRTFKMGLHEPDDDESTTSTDFSEVADETAKGMVNKLNHFHEKNHSLRTVELSFVSGYTCCAVLFIVSLLI